MQLSETIKLYPTKYQKDLIVDAMSEYISSVNSVVSIASSGTSIKKYSSKDINANLPSTIRGQICRDARSIVNKHYKECRKAVLRNRKFAKQGKDLRVLAPKMPVLKKPVCYINNQNFKVYSDSIEFPMIVDNKSKRIKVKCSITDRQYSLISTAKLGTMRIVFKNNKLCAQIVYEVPEVIYNSNENVMGVDLGIKCPAVCYTNDGKVKFIGNGRKNKWLKRFYRHQRKKLQSAKKDKVVKRIANKESNVFKDIDHKLSAEIVKTAVSNNVKTIRLERLQNIRSTTRKSRKNNHSLHNWSFYRLAQFIEYKAKLSGISVEYVNPAYTSQYCPHCGELNHAEDRNYKCKCGYHTHRDIVGAINICHSTAICGKSISA